MTAGAPPRSLADRIIWARKRKGISQESLAGMIGTSRRHMIRIEKGVRPGPEFRRRIAEATGQALEFFEDGTPDAGDDEEAAERMSLDDFLHRKVEQAIEQAWAARLAREGATT